MLNKWLEKKKQETLRRWKANQISLGEAASELVRLGYPPLIAWWIVEST
jgi:hypothetical protein